MIIHFFTVFLHTLSLILVSFAVRFLCAVSHRHVHIDDGYQIK